MLSSVFLFLNIGGSEMALILFAALMLFGGDKLPEIARGLGKGIREFKDASDDVKREINNQINNYKEDLKPDLNIDAKTTAEEATEHVTPLLEENNTEHALEVTEHPNYVGKNPVANTIPVGDIHVSSTTAATNDGNTSHGTVIEPAEKSKEEHNS